MSNNKTINICEPDDEAIINISGTEKCVTVAELVEVYLKSKQTKKSKEAEVPTVSVASKCEDKSTPNKHANHGNGNKWYINGKCHFETSTYVDTSTYDRYNGPA